jgi:hypothetical protein
MEEITIDELVDKAKALHKEGKKWHFHMLTPDCMFNERKDKQAFVLEDEQESQGFVTYSDKKYMGEREILLKMLHGKEVLEEKLGRREEDANIRAIVEKARRFNEQGIPWHHHVFFPNCIFNKHQGKWCIAFEDKEEDRVIESISDSEPKEDLKEIEPLFSAQKG